MKKSKRPNIESTTSLINESILFGLIDAQFSQSDFLRISMGPIFQRMLHTTLMQQQKSHWKDEFDEKRKKEKTHYVNKLRIIQCELLDILTRKLVIFVLKKRFNFIAFIYYIYFFLLHASCMLLPHVLIYLVHSKKVNVCKLCIQIETKPHLFLI